MSTNYTAQDVRNILEVFVGEYLVDIPTDGILQTPYYLGEGETVVAPDLLFSETALATHIFYAAEDKWFEEIAAFANGVE